MTTTPTFKSGHVVYDKQGNPALYGHPVHGGHLVFPCVWLDGDDGECSALNHVKWPEVFHSPPEPSPWLMIILGACIIVVLAVGALS